MSQKAKVTALMVEHKCSRTKANNMLRKRANGDLEKDGTRKNKRKSVSR
jgi:hypothetical protein